MSLPATTIVRPVLGDIEVPSMAQAQQALVEAQRLFHRTLACWASDALLLRRRRRDRVQWEFNQSKAAMRRLNKAA